MIHSPIKTWLIFTSYQNDLKEKYVVAKIQIFIQRPVFYSSDDKWRKLSSSVFYIIWLVSMKINGEGVLKNQTNRGVSES